MTDRHDWTIPGAYEVSPGVHRIPVPLPLAALHAVNDYVMSGPDGLTVVDAGWATDDARVVLADGLRRLGHTLDDISRFVVTHAHWDHYTHAIAVREAHGARVLLGRGEEPSVVGFDRDDVSYPKQVPLLRRAGASALADRIAVLWPDADERAVPLGEPDSWLDDRDVVSLPDRSLEVFATPGHTRGHIVLRDGQAGLLFSGDHVLPHITPSLAVERTPERYPLRSFLQSLQLVRDQPDTRLLPAHGPVTESAHVRVDELLAHHGARLDAVERVVADGADTAALAAAALRWTRRERMFDELDDINQMLAVLEIDAHLDVLEEMGRARGTLTGDGVVHWTVR